VRNAEGGKTTSGGKLGVQTRKVDVAKRDRKPQGRRSWLSGHGQTGERQYSVEERSVREDEPKMRKCLGGRQARKKPELSVRNGEVERERGTQ
jgi:hypothetical protein